MKPALPDPVQSVPPFSPPAIVALSFLAICAFAVADFLTPAPMSFVSLYLLVVGFAGWHAGHKAAWLVAALSITAIDLVHFARQSPPARIDEILLWNNALYAACFCGAGWVTASLRKAHRVVRQSERKYRRLHETMTDAFVSVDMSGQILEFNPAYQTLLGYSPDELRVQTYVNLTPEKWHPMEARIVAEEILPHGYSGVYEKEYRRKDGTVFPVELRTFLVRDDAGKPAAMWAIVRDITERKRAAEALQLARDRLEERVRERTTELQAANNALRHSEERYRSLVHNLNVGVFRNTPGPEGRFLEVNPALARLHGYDSVEEFMQVRVADLYQDRSERGAFVKELLRTGKVLDHELRLKRRDGQPIFATVSATAHRAPDGQVDWIDGVIEDVTERRRLERQILEISDDEQARIGQDLHDGLCQELVGLAFDANSLAAQLERARHPEQMRAERIADCLDHAITEARHLARGLFPVRLEGDGLGPALAQLVQGVAERFPGQCSYEQSQTVHIPAKATATQLYRIAQEALNNALKYSGAKRICLRLSWDMDALLLEVEDDGIGTRLEANSQGMGLHIMRYRARSIGADLSVTPGNQAGTVVRCRVPRVNNGG